MDGILILSMPNRQNKEEKKENMVPIKSWLFSSNPDFEYVIAAPERIKNNGI